MSFAVIILTAVFTDNFLLSRFMGICPFLGVSGKLTSSLGMGLAVTFVMTVSAAVTYPLYHGVLVPLKIEFMNTIAFILLIALFVQIVEMVLKRYVTSLYKMLGVYLPLITTNCAVLGVTLLNITSGYDFAHSVFNSFCTGIGFMLVLLIFAGVRSRVEKGNVPAALKGTPVTLIAAAIVSLSFVGFGGLV